ncbi:MAG: T9SS type A sorting domain-containing protein [Saprospiraceae bacterium]|nr:T9SS type A sorting domain-containing protein [Saprospiraceae bacterium]
MKRMLLAVFSALCIHATAQITITNATFPAAGDSLRSSIDLNPDVSSSPASPPGGDQTWDFNNLQADQPSLQVYAAASAGMYDMDFPGSDLVNIGLDGETYFNVTNTAFQVLGYAGGDPTGFGLNITARFQPPFDERRAPLNFFDITSQTTNLILPFSTEQLPDSLFAGAPFIPDSIRVRINTQRLEVVDGWGNCKIPGGEYNVLRQKRTEYTNTSIDVKIPVLGWIDISQFGGGGLGGFIGTDTTVTYRFLSGTEKVEIAVATMSNDLSTVERIRYKDNMVVSSQDVDAPGTASIQAFPNPAIEWVRFDCANLPSDDYTLKIFNIVGKVVWKEDYQLSGNKSITLNLSEFKKGTYLYSLTDGKGNNIGTKRLVVLKP